MTLHASRYELTVEGPVLRARGLAPASVTIDVPSGETRELTINLPPR